MLNSVEVRWVFEGKLPEVMETWADTFQAKHQPVRTDYYFHKHDQGTLGIKLREGNIQIKPLINTLSKYSFGAHEGQLEQYTKWSYAVEDNKEWSFMIQHPETWVEITKSRKMTRFTLEGGFPDRIEMGVNVEEGCEMELSHLSVRDQDYWTLAFEAFGTTPEENLHKVLRHIFETSEPPVTLSLENSFGYAQLIHDIQS
ncbi:hypothetical protein [Fulvivirga ligni]|uniref:hypothetical protein n=1 Tax=Fulvivirga ligni TaxID=2904246 RepID=UPI001F3BA58F|nr:hypothetical protein [Fulvivirga ligni]UII22188.1 hypothetical protein LVD16_02945 [Fulvivirga ligni]